MAFKPTNKVREKLDIKYPVPNDGESGNLPARISLIVDLGVQPREDFYDKEKDEYIPRKPAHQVLIYADLTTELVDYGGHIGMAHYRLPLFHTFKGEMSGINFMAVPSDKPGGLPTFPTNSILTKLAKCSGTKTILEDKENLLDIEMLLGKPLMVEIEVTDGKTRDDGSVPKYTKFKGVSSIPKGMNAPPELLTPALLVGVNNIDEESFPFIRYKTTVINKLMLCEDFYGSKLESMLLEDGVDLTNYDNYLPPDSNQEEEQPEVAVSGEVNVSSVDDSEEGGQEPGNIEEYDDDIPF